MDVRKLPPEFLLRMRELLGDEYDAFLASYEQESRHGLRVNTLKISAEEFKKISPFKLEEIPWIGGGFEISREDGAGRHPFYYAGLYYLQDPSAMTPAHVLDVQPGQRVLDLCAAPGGKATALGAKLKGSGVLAANDISASRCRALLKNLEVFGIPNAVITNEVPARLGERFPAFFDRILVDAPCSGEGMFRKEEAVARAWYPEKNAECAKIQKDLIVRAADMLRDGGHMLYSTCTFSPAENEEVIAFLLRERPQMHLIPIPGFEGFAEGISGAGPYKSGLGDPDAARCVRIWPHRMRGEGHFLAMLQKGEETAAGDFCASLPAFSYEEGLPAAGRRERRRAQELVEAFCRDSALQIPGYAPEKLYLRGDMVFMAALPEKELKRISCIRNGLLLGELKKDRFEPSQALAMALSGAAPAARLDLGLQDDRIIRYLKGETLTLAAEECTGNGWKIVSAGGYPLGWAKETGAVLKNKYLAGWRMK